MAGAVGPRALAGPAQLLRQAQQDPLGPAHAAESLGVLEAHDLGAHHLDSLVLQAIRRRVEVVDGTHHPEVAERVDRRSAVVGDDRSSTTMPTLSILRPITPAWGRVGRRSVPVGEHRAVRRLPLLGDPPVVPDGDRKLRHQVGSRAVEVQVAPADR